MNLIIGATGTVGRELVKQLSSAGVKVRALTRDPTKAASIRGPQVEIFSGDLAKPETLDRALTGMDRVFLLSAPDPRSVELQGNLIRAAQRAGIKLLIKFSALGASPDSSSSLLRWHGQIEREVRAAGIPYVILRPNFFMQIFLGYAGLISSTGVLPAPLRDGKISMVDVRDLAAVAAKILTGTGFSGKTYELTGPESLSFREVADRLSRVRGKKVTYRDVSPEEAQSSLVATGMPEWFAAALVELYGLFSMGLGNRVTNAVTDLTGKSPRSFDRFARDYREVFSGQAAKAA